MSVVKHSVIYLGSSIVAKGAPFLLLPFLTNYLEPAQFGVLAIFLVMNSLYGAFIGMAIHTNVAKNFFKKTKSELALITGNVLIILLVSFTVYLVVTLLLVLFTDTIFSVPSELLLILPFLAFLSMLNQIHLAVLRNEGRAYRFGAFEISNAFISVGITVVLLIFMDAGWLSQVIGMVVATFLLSLIGLYYLKTQGYINFTFRKLESISILKLSIPLVPHVLGGVVIAASDRLFIEQMVGLEAVALYSIGYSFGMVVSLFTDALIKAWSPWFYKQLVEPTHEKKIKIVQSTYFYLVGVFVIAFVISLLGELILPYIVAKDYDGAAQYIWWIALGYAMHGVYKIFFPYLVHISKTQFLAFSTVMAAIINLLFNYLLINQYGAMGAAYATIIAFTVSALLVFEYQRRKFPMPWNFRGLNGDKN